MIQSLQGTLKTHWTGNFVEQARRRQEEHERQEKVLESDSELSELASSVFNGMEGIEVGSGTTICQGQGQEADEIGGVAPIEIGDSEVMGRYLVTVYI